MACLITSGIPKGCKDNSGGVRKVFIANTANITSITPTVDGDTTGLITAITLVSGSYFHEFEPNKMSSNVVENIQSNIQNGTIGYEQVVTLVFAKNEASKRNQIKLLGQAEVAVIIQDYNNKYFLYGEQNGLELSGGNSVVS